MNSYIILPPNGRCRVPNNNLIVFEFDDGRKIIATIPDDRIQILYKYANDNASTLEPEQLEIFLQRLGIKPK